MRFETEELDPEVLERAKEIRMQREGIPLGLPDDTPLEILKECVRTIDLYLSHYKEDKDGTSFRYMKRSELQNIDKARMDRRQIIEEAANQLAWLLEDDPPVGEGISFYDVCDFQGVDPQMGRKLLIDSLFGKIHENALLTLKEYLEWKGDIETECECDTCQEFSDNRKTLCKL